VDGAVGKVDPAAIGSLRKTRSTRCLYLSRSLAVDGLADDVDSAVADGEVPVQSYGGWWDQV